MHHEYSFSLYTGYEKSTQQASSAIQDTLDIVVQQIIKDWAQVLENEADMKKVLID